MEDYLMSGTAPGSISHSAKISPKDRDNKLLGGHTYTILKVKEVFNHKLINIRNNWGCFEWDGAWSRKSAFWTPDIKEKLEPNLENDDGTFWMSYEDFCRHFAALNVTKTKNCNEVRLKGKFVKIDDEET
jgi:hypothetical protein